MSQQLESSNRNPFWVFIAAAFITLVYWTILIFTSRMEISADAVGYEALGRQIRERGFEGLFLNGPNREPLFPALIALAMCLGEWFRVDYQYVQKFLHLFIILFSSWLIFLSLDRFRVRSWIIFVTVLYWGVSPGIVNSGLSLFSEVAIYPFVLFLIISAARAWSCCRNSDGGLLAEVAFLSASTVGLILVKSYFEVGYIFFLLPFAFAALVCLLRGEVAKAGRFALVLLIPVIVVSGVCHVYRSLNQKYNGQYVMTDRGAWAFYGNAAKRAVALTPAMIKAAVAYIPGEGVCRKVASERDCWAVSFQAADAKGIPYMGALSRAGMSSDQVNKTLLRDGFRLIQSHPGQYFFFFVTEGVKFLFWESTQTGFVDYPAWLDSAYSLEWVRYVFRFGLALLTLAGLVWACGVMLQFKGADNLRIFVGFALLYIGITAGLYAMFSVLTRYIFIVVPLYLILIALWVDRGLLRGRTLNSPEI